MLFFKLREPRLFGWISSARIKGWKFPEEIKIVNESYVACCTCCFEPCIETHVVKAGPSRGYVGG